MGGKLLAPVRILELLVVALAGAGIALGGRRCVREARRPYDGPAGHVADADHGALDGSGAGRRADAREDLRPGRPGCRPDHRDDAHAGTDRSLRLSGRPDDRAVTRLGLRDRQGRPHRHQLPCRPGRRAGAGLVLRAGSAEREGRREGSFDRRRRPEDRRARTRAHAAAPGRLRLRHRRRCGLCDREPVRLHAHVDDRRRQRRTTAAPGSRRRCRSSMPSRQTPRSTTATRVGR